MEGNEENPERDGRDPPVGRLMGMKKKKEGTGRGSKVEITGAEAMSSG